MYNPYIPENTQGDGTSASSSVSFPTPPNNIDTTTTTSTTSNQNQPESIISNFFTNTNNPNAPTTRITNKHISSSTHPFSSAHIKKKKQNRKTNIRACDACAIRKVKCESTRPCSHCVSNHLNCTQLRERKKSGPKTLHKKTLDSINSLSEVIEKNTFPSSSRPSLSKSSSTNTVLYSKEVSAPYEDMSHGGDGGSSSNDSTPSVSTAAYMSNVSSSITTPPVVSTAMGPGPVMSASASAPIPMTSSVSAPLPGRYNTRPMPQQQHQQLRQLAPPPPQSSDVVQQDYIVTPYNLIENLNLIGEEPSIYELVKPLTIPSLMLDYRKLVDFLISNYPNMTSANKDIPNPFHSEINLIDHHDDSLYLSNLLIILTLNQIVAEVLIKLKKQKFRSFISYSKKKLMFRQFKTFKNLCHFKILEIFSLIEKNFIVPPVVPQHQLKSPTIATSTTSSNSNNAVNTSAAYQFPHLLQYQIYYNLSLTCLHLCTYYHILNLTNTLNMTNNKGQKLNYGNEAQEHQKIIYMNRAITYFRLINVNRNYSSGNTHNEDEERVRELYITLFTFERYWICFSSHNYNLNYVRNNDVILQLDDSKRRGGVVANGGNGGGGFLYRLMKVAESIIEPICNGSNFNVLLEYNDEFSMNLENFTQIRGEIETAIQGIEMEHIETVVKNILLFKVLLIYPLSFQESKAVLLEIIMALNEALEVGDCDVFKVQMSNYQLLQPMLHMLKIALEMKSVETTTKMFPEGNNSQQDQEILIRYSDNLLKHFPFFNNINKLIRAHKILNNWFLNLSEYRRRESERQEQEAQQQQQQVKQEPHDQGMSMRMVSPPPPPAPPQHVPHHQQHPMHQFTNMTPHGNAASPPFMQQQLQPPPSSGPPTGPPTIRSDMFDLDISYLLKDFHGSNVDESGGFMSNNSSTNTNNSGHNYSPEYETYQQQQPPHRPEDEEDDEYEEEEEDDGIFTIVPRQQHGNSLAAAVSTDQGEQAKREEEGKSYTGYTPNESSGAGVGVGGGGNNFGNSMSNLTMLGISASTKNFFNLLTTTPGANNNSSGNNNNNFDDTSGAGGVNGGANGGGGGGSGGSFLRLFPFNNIESSSRDE
ncbi:uncharacterized protein J8A68_004923 [[Candida] subhashii]|uniref:Zn(2)-C6 fungal-type domain-containing protein n=1 Tax=[Candida] subhashii TaxID=561895 RepID=A0A8J5QG91_9ASCO|nr:uncharacterized protein J8A68_004923 [[Candida] subhashii]KAG7661554.1 hypothetical protein J8A68_004923 [[Candida] subhashii]